MEFIDHTGHIFSQKSYNEKPIGYEFEQNKYIFWVDNEYSTKLSVNTYYIKPIRLLLNKNVTDISIELESSIFNLISSKKIQENIDSDLNVELSEYSDFAQSLSLNDLYTIKDDENILIPFYVICLSTEEATWTTQVLITVKYSDGTLDYCPITVGAVFQDELEELVINGKNMGVNLPKSIIDAIYQHSIYSDTADEHLYNEKIKEYLMNYMQIKGECGNFRSAINSLKWFGWGDKISLVHLLQTDNDALSQYIRDTFDINTDTLSSYNFFKSSTLIDLIVKENNETEDQHNFDFSKDFWGENTPVLKDLFDKVVEKKYDEQDITFYAQYYQYSKIELAIKLSCLKYYYNKYFLPIHLGIHNASIEHKCYTNDIKLLSYPFTKICEQPQLCDDNGIIVKFPANSTQFLYTSQHYVDENYNEFTNTKEIGESTNENVYAINELCVAIPIKIKSTEPDKILNCTLVLERAGNLIFESNFLFAQQTTYKYEYKRLTDLDFFTTEDHGYLKNSYIYTDSNTTPLEYANKNISDEDGTFIVKSKTIDKVIYDYSNFVIVPKIFNKNKDINYWLDNDFSIHLCVNGKWFDYTFDIAIPELNIEYGTIQYKYDKNLVKQIDNISDSSVDFRSYMYLPSLVDVNNISFPKEVIDYTNKGNILKFIKQYREESSINASSKYYNKVHYYKLYKNGEELRYYDSQNIVELYKTFFNTDGSDKKLFNIDRNNFKYDMYIMHDDVDTESYKGILSDEDLRVWKPCWYVIFISTSTLDKKEYPNDDIPSKTLSYGDYTIEYQKSDKKFLINRMKYIPANGNNIFKSNDIIVGTINNIDLPFIMNLGTKWKISPYSLKMESDSEIFSSTNTFLMSIGGDNSQYSKGYYNISVRYSIDGNTQQEITSKSRILVK